MHIKNLFLSRNIWYVGILYHLELDLGSLGMDQQKFYADFINRHIISVVEDGVGLDPEDHWIPLYHQIEKQVPFSSKGS